MTYGDRWREDALSTAMSAAVPLEIARISEMDDGQREWLRQQLVPLMQDGADSMLYGGRNGARAFAAYAKALALLSFNHGGVARFGQGWCAAHPAERFTEYPCPRCLAEEIAAREAA